MMDYTDPQKNLNGPESNPTHLYVFDVVDSESAVGFTSTGLVEGHFKVKSTSFSKTNCK